jgi:hypothetical protein
VPLTGEDDASRREEVHMKRHRRNRAFSGTTGPCETFDAACGERATNALKWCEEKYEGEYLEDLRKCIGKHRRQACEDEAYKSYREKVLACVEE